MTLILKDRSPVFESEMLWPPAPVRMNPTPEPSDGVSDEGTVMEHAPVFPFDEVASTIVWPAFTPVTTPSEETVATAGSMLFQVTVFDVAATGSTVALRVMLSPTPIVADEGETLTLDTSTT